MSKDYIQKHFSETISNAAAIISFFVNFALGGIISPYLKLLFCNICFNSDILANESIVEQRLTSGDLVQGNLIKENESNLQMCKKYGLNCILIDL